MTSTSPIRTAEDLLRARDIGRCELVHGELVALEWAGLDHGWLAMRLGSRIAAYVEQRDLGAVYAAGTGFILWRNPDTVRAADVGFVRCERIPPTSKRGFFDGAPDLAVEVVSPDDRASEVLAKVQDWLTAGCALVWVVDPRSQTLTAYQPGGRAQVYGAADRVPGAPVLPEFTLALAEVLRA